MVLCLLSATAVPDLDPAAMESPLPRMLEQEGERVTVRARWWTIGPVFTTGTGGVLLSVATLHGPERGPTGDRAVVPALGWHASTAMLMVGVLVLLGLEWGHVQHGRFRNAGPASPPRWLHDERARSSAYSADQPAEDHVRDV
jgi:hypothetical protein